MRINGIRSKRRRKFKVTTHSKHTRPVASNLIQRDFTAQQPDRLWTSDITYIRTQEGWLYLAIFLDACSRRAESFFATLKTELIYDERYRTRNQARRSIFKYIEMFYNRNRIHTALGGLSPDQYEKFKSAA
jgi:transposase InsO family protein